MNVAVAKTKAEQAFTENFEAVAGKLPGGAAVDEVRRQAIGVFAAAGLPHRRIEEWKYTDLRSLLKQALAPAVRDETPVKSAAVKAALGPLAAIDAHAAVFVNGSYRADLSRIEGSADFELRPLGEALAKAPHKVGESLARLGREPDAVLALNTAFMTDGAVVRIRDGVVLYKPLLLISARTGRESAAVTTRHVVSVGRDARASIVEVSVALGGAGSDAQANAATEIVVGDGAVVTHAKVTLDGAQATHLSSWIASLGAKSHYRGFQLTANTGLARNQIFLTFGGEGAKLDLSGVFLGRGTDHIDTTLVVDHAVPHCESRELFKGVLADRARGVFQGKIVVRPDAQKTDGKQMAQVLMLSPDAEFDSKPELEIFADDVVCGHGSTAAEIDSDLVFYCRSRGIPEADAKALLIQSFVGEAVEQVQDEAVREALRAIAQGWLEAKAA